MASRGGSRRRAASRSRFLLRWIALGALALIGFLYYQPVRSYLDARASLAERRAEVQALERQRERLERRLADSQTGLTLLRNARRLGFVKPGERLYIVKGIREWKRAQARPPRAD